MQDIHAQRILILDFGSQYTQLIARRVRELGVYCEIHSYAMSEEAIQQFNPQGIILSGGPDTVTAEHSPRAPQIIFSLGRPILGICYGMQTMAEQLGGKVESATHREYGPAQLTLVKKSHLFEGIEDHTSTKGEGVIEVWMSHGDRVITLPPGFECIAASPNAPMAAMGNEAQHWYGVQFHPEVTHTPQGLRMLERFLKTICGCEGLWTSERIISDSIARIKEQVGRDGVLLGLSGGVDSAVVAALLHRAIGDQLVCVFVDHGLMREGERQQVQAVFTKHLGVKVIYVEAQNLFLNALVGVTDPEEKRKIIGKLFIEVFDQEAEKLCLSDNSAGARVGRALARPEGENATMAFSNSDGNTAGASNSKNEYSSQLECQQGAERTNARSVHTVHEDVRSDGNTAGASIVKSIRWLAQGTIYPDVIESSHSASGKAKVIKSHHNVGGLPENMRLQLLEPLRELFKDEVRKLGLELGLPYDLVYRHPFPGPGLAVRILGEIKSDYVSMIRKADAIFMEELRNSGWYEKVSQAFAVFLPVRSVGVMGDERSYDYVVALRAVETIDFMTAHWVPLPYELLQTISSRIINEVRGIARVTYDISHKPPATIEWE